MTPWLDINPVVRAVGIALVEFVWHGAAIGAVAMLVLFACRRATAQARYLVACVALAAMAAAPVLSVVTHFDDQRRAMPPDQAGDAAVDPAAAGIASIAQPPMAVEPSVQPPVRSGSSVAVRRADLGTRRGGLHGRSLAGMEARAAAASLGDRAPIGSMAGAAGRPRHPARRHHASPADRVGDCGRALRRRLAAAGHRGAYQCPCGTGTVGARSRSWRTS